MTLLAFQVVPPASAANTNAQIQLRTQATGQSVAAPEKHVWLVIDTNAMAAARQLLKNDEVKASSFFDRNKDVLNFLVQTVGVVGGLVGVFFLAYQIHLSVEGQRLANLQMLTTAHRETWSILLEHDDLCRIFDINADIKKTPISEKEKLVTNFFILHLNTSFHLIKSKMVRNIGELEDDVRDFFSCPLPRAVWDDTKAFHDKDLVNFVETTLASTTSNNPPNLKRCSPSILRLLHLS